MSGVSLEFIIHERIPLAWLLSKWVPKILNFYKKQYKLLIVQSIVTAIRKRRVTVTKIRLNQFDPENKYSGSTWFCQSNAIPKI